MSFMLTSHGEFNFQFSQNLLLDRSWYIRDYTVLSVRALGSSFLRILWAHHCKCDLQRGHQLLVLLLYIATIYITIVALYIFIRYIYIYIYTVQRYYIVYGYKKKCRVQKRKHHEHWPRTNQALASCLPLDKGTLMNINLCWFPNKDNMVYAREIKHSGIGNNAQGGVTCMHDLTSEDHTTFD